MSVGAIQYYAILLPIIPPRMYIPSSRHRRHGEKPYNQFVADIHYMSRSIHIVGVITLVDMHQGSQS